MNKVLVICHLTDSKCNGQVAKTQDTIDFLKHHGYEVDILNYGKLNAFGKIFKSPGIVKKYKTIVLMPGGKKALFFYVKLLSKLKDVQLHYMTVGGWVLKLLKDESNKKIFEKLKRFSGIYLQNQETHKEFLNRGFENAYYVSNFSYKKPITKEQFESKLSIYDKDKYRFCFFARIIREKGVLLACKSIDELCKKYPNKKISLDIYGESNDPVLENEINSFVTNNPSISMKGVIFGEETIRTLSNYYCMLFPTYYKGEGTPHTIVESFMAGLPIIASNWAYNAEIVQNGKTGLIFDLKDDELTKVIEYAINNPDIIKDISKKCFEESKRYNPNILLKPLLEKLES